MPTVLLPFLIHHAIHAHNLEQKSVHSSQKKILLSTSITSQTNIPSSSGQIDKSHARAPDLTSNPPDPSHSSQPVGSSSAPALPHPFPRTKVRFTAPVSQAAKTRGGEFRLCLLCSVPRIHVSASWRKCAVSWAGPSGRMSRLQVPGASIRTRRRRIA
ncbi:uncharacterized protein BDR25DRAFT_132563 [Lindgomyces ingoldianus]|uniref:Uncharacterized protein n=1 Tax=Lindgomyces ingoldianus TaxID=673940 RepID=A0ACB6R2W3_9PLEO|nr:uncharacterized protein BDR25DRAFT_132563 [Lindgomyces ingoldianus]KAF2473486.1 hypothetical protein BDR25DRAFT_132563 [Lindgomyces ingoldianus]